MKIIALSAAKGSAGRTTVAAALAVAAASRPDDDNDRTDPAVGLADLDPQG